jgi:hypothetical protein
VQREVGLLPKFPRGLPGLGGSVRRSAKRGTALARVFLSQANAIKTLEAGVTTVRDLTGFDSADLAMRDLMTALSHIVANVIPLCNCEAAERLFELPRCFQSRHIRRVIAQTLPPPDIFLRRQALGHPVIILDDLACCSMLK